jgi:membrane-bound ClpP family serine protease
MKLSTPSLLVLGLLGTICCIGGLLMDMPNTFMLQELEKRGASTGQIQGIFSMYALAVLCT